MKLITEVPIKPSPEPIDYTSKVLCLGSCFAEHISKKLEFFKFNHVSNPFGILFHPEAILNVVERAVKNEVFTDDDVFQHQQKWHSFYAHSRLSRNSSAELLSALNSAKQQLREAAETSTHIIITLGTSYIYKHKPSGLGVANCHKIPQDAFEKELTPVSVLRSKIKDIKSCFEKTRTDIKLIFTVSPVRHIKDGIVENQRSKAHLISALHEILENQLNAAYFPSYELMMDELRDYRYYDRDLIHPSALAVDLIWERFRMNYISKSIYQDMNKVEKLQKSLAHRPTNSRGEAFEKLKVYQAQLKRELSSQYPFMTFPSI